MCHMVQLRSNLIAIYRSYLFINQYDLIKIRKLVALKNIKKFY